MDVIVERFQKNEQIQENKEINHFNNHLVSYGKLIFWSNLRDVVFQERRISTCCGDCKKKTS
jgi:hypothetical protein